MMEQYYWVRYLVEHRQLAAAGPGKMMVVLGLSHLDVRDKLPGTRDSKFVDQLFSRHGLFDYDPRHGIEPKPLSQAERFVILEKMRDRGVLLQLGNDVRDELLAHPPWARRGPAPRPDADQAAMDLQMVLMGGSDRWQSAVEHQVGYLSMTIDYLRQHQISVAAVLLPMKRFNDRQPFAAAFHDAVRRLCLEKQVPLTDYSRSMPDSEFADATHLNYVGQHKLSPMMLAPAVDHLKRVGLIP